MGSGYIDPHFLDLDTVVDGSFKNFLVISHVSNSTALRNHEMQLPSKYYPSAAIYFC
jgi:hypothetical protein